MLGWEGICVPFDFSFIISMLFLAFWLFIIVAVVVRKLKGRFSPVKRVRAVVVDKHRVEFFSKYAGNGKTERYVVTFSAEGKRLSFYVSAFSYAGYTVNESGTLTYQGDRLIGFR